MVGASDSVSETLDSSSSISVNDRIVDSTDAASSSSSSSSSDPHLSRNVSFSRLNAQAPEFVPRSSSSSPSPSPSPSPNSSSSASSSIPQPPPPRVVIPQPPPPALVHLYQPAAAAAAASNSPFHVPIQTHHPHPHHHVPVQYHPHPHHPPHHHQQFHRQYYGGGGGHGGGDHQEVAVQAQQQQQQAPAEHDHVSQRKDESNQKLLNQVEYYFSDVNLATTDHLMRFINKDPEGYVPISVVASFKKIKALISSHSQLATILRSSTKLVVSEDGKKVKRQHPLTEADMEELQCRIIVAENLPEDHCHQNLMKIFSAVGSVKTIRTCPPQITNGGPSSASRSKAEGMLFSNKLHAFVEYETIELAEKAVADLNDEGNWRSGLRVRLLLRRPAKSSEGRVKKVGHEDEVNCEEDETSTSDPHPVNEKSFEDPSQQSGAQSHEHIGDEHAADKEGGQKKGRSRGRGKGRGRPQYNHNHHHNRSGGNHHHVGTPPQSSNLSTSMEHPIVSKQPPGPRMPDGTRGFSMGRGKPLAINIRE